MKSYSNLFITNKQNIKIKIIEVMTKTVFILSIFLSIYMGIWLMFIHPLLEIGKAYDSNILTGEMVLIAILKCYFAGCVVDIIFSIGKKISEKIGELA